MVKTDQQIKIEKKFYIQLNKNHEYQEARINGLTGGRDGPVDLELAY